MILKLKKHPPRHAETLERTGHLRDVEHFGLARILRRGHHRVRHVQVRDLLQAALLVLVERVRDRLVAAHLRKSTAGASRKLPERSGSQWNHVGAELFGSFTGSCTVVKLLDCFKSS